MKRISIVKFFDLETKNFLAHQNENKASLQLSLYSEAILQFNCCAQVGLYIFAHMLMSVGAIRTNPVSAYFFWVNMGKV